MAFNNVGPPTFLAAGQDAWWWYSFGDDHGTRLASPDIKTPNQGGVQIAGTRGRRRTTTAVRPISSGSRIRPGGCFHNLQGGGPS